MWGGGEIKQKGKKWNKGLAIPFLLLFTNCTFLKGKKCSPWNMQIVCVRFCSTQQYCHFCWRKCTSSITSFPVGWKASQELSGLPSSTSCGKNNFRLRGFANRAARVSRPLFVVVVVVIDSTRPKSMASDACVARSRDGLIESCTCRRGGPLGRPWGVRFGGRSLAQHYGTLSCDGW